MKKVSSFLLMLLSLLVLVSFAQVNALGEITESAGAKYYAQSIIESNKLDYGVTHTKESGFTSTPLSGYDVDGLGGQSGYVVSNQFYPQQVNFLEVPVSSGVKITNWGNLNNHRWTLTTVRNLIADYESKNPEWRVVAAINGDFFDISGSGNLPYQTSGALVSGGEYFKTTSGNTVGFTNNGTADSLIGNQTVSRTQYMQLAVYDTTGAIVKEFDIEKVNEAPGENQTAVYYANYNTLKEIVPIDVIVNPTSNAYFVDSAQLALPNRTNDFYGKGQISSFASKTIAKGQFAIVTNNPTVAAALGKDITIRVQYEYTGAYAGVSDVCGGGSTIMRDGVANPNAGLGDRAPRTVVGKKADGTIVMMVVDGRQSAINMYGADRYELSAIMASRGVVDAYNLDGGGSSTMVIRNGDELRVMNSPSDGRERTDANCLLIVVHEPDLELDVSEKTETTMTLDVAVTNPYFHKIDKLLVRVNMQLQEVVDGKVTFTGLRANKEYNIDLFYRTPTGVMYQINFEQNAYTLKRVPEFYIVELVESETSYTFVPNFLDQDQATNLLIASLYVNGVEHLFVDGLLTINRSEVTSLDEVKLVYSVDIGLGATQYTVINPMFYSTLALNEVLDQQFIFISNLYE
ncbi:MAG: phosphodiester glycosidase family protein [Bacilli bacterium]